MAYIGRQPEIGNFQICDAISTVNNQAAYTMQVSSVNVEPETANHMIVSLNGVIQKPNSSYTVAGAVITFASNLVTGDVINFIQILGSVLDLGVPSDDTVTAAKLSSNAITTAKILDANVTTAKILDNNITTAKILDSNVTTAKVADNAVTLAKMASGTDGNIISYDTSGNPVAVATGNDGQVLTSAGAGAVPTFETLPAGGLTEVDQWRPTVYTSGASTTITSWERPDTAGATYLGTGMTQSSGIFTFPETGKYWIQFKATGDSNSNSLYNGIAIYTTLNNSSYAQAAISYMSFPANNSYGNASISFIFDVTNTTNCKIRFQSAGVQAGLFRILGGTATNESEVTFIRIGDT